MLQRGAQESPWHLPRLGPLLSPPWSPLPPSPEPQITSPPYDTWNITGQDVIFGCEVFAYPMASIEWRKDGTEMLLPGDDPHISVQVSCVPRALKMTPE